MVETLRQLSLRALRADNKLSQKQLAEQIGVTPRSISIWESDTKKLQSVSIATFKKMANVLHCSVDEIFLGDTSENTNTDERGVS